MNNRDVLIWLNSIEGITNKIIDNLQVNLGDISRVWNLSENSLRSLHCISEKIQNNIIKYRSESYFEKLIMNMEKSQIKTVTIYDNQYPEKLRNIFDYPKVMYTKGDMIKEDEPVVAIVGSRKATAYGKWAAEKFARELSKMGIIIISGMARGIDTVAHLGALKEEGKTIAVLGNGLDIVYPKSNVTLFNSIASNGCILTEFSPGTQPLPFNFPQRNRIISGLSLGVVVIEASEKSGSLITAYHAIEQGREVFALPGNINSIYSKGTNLLIKDGAKVVLDLDDILEEIQELKYKVQSNKSSEIDYDKLSEDESKIVKCISEKPLHCDMISYITGLKITTVNSILTILEMKGLISQLPGKIFTIN